MSEACENNARSIIERLEWLPPEEDRIIPREKLPIDDLDADILLALRDSHGELVEVDPGWLWHCEERNLRLQSG